MEPRADYHLLLVEDNPGDARLLEVILRENRRRLRFDITVAETSAEGTRLARATRQDLVLLDLTLPDREGLDSLQAMLAACPDTPVVVLTGMDDVNLGVKCVKAGAQDFITKDEISPSIDRTILYAIERKRAQMELIAQEERLHQIIHYNVDALVVVNAQGLIRFANPAAERLLGESAQQLLNTPFTYPIPPLGAAEIIIRRDDQMITAELRAVSHDWDGESCALCSLRDISERVEMERQLQTAKELADQANRFKSEFLANMSHEIRTPMNSILGFAELLEDEVDNARLKSRIQSIRSNGKILLSLINDILDLSKIEAGKLRLEYEPVNPRRLIHEMRQVFDQALDAKGLEFIVNAPDDFPDALILDETRFRQVLLNLIGNAVKFTDSGRVSVSLAAQPGASGHSSVDLTLTVTDTGVGIPKDQLEPIFEAFNQQSSQRVNPYGGTGLGLTITRRLVSLMGGSIRARSEYGKGSSFEARFPNIAIAAMECPNPKQAEEDFKTIAFAPAVVLVADDNNHNRQLLMDYLHALGLTPLDARTGREAVDVATHQLPQLILMDIKMPGMDGLEATHELKENPATRGIPIVAVTASVMKETEARVFNLCDGLLRKPIHKNELIQELLQFLPHARKTAAALNETLDARHENGKDNQSLVPETPNVPPRDALIASTRREGVAFSLDELTDVAKRAMDMGQRNAIESLTELGQKLLAAVDFFDIDQIPDIVSEIRVLESQTREVIE